MKEIIRILWPIKKGELSRFIPIALIIFFILFNYSLIHAIKDSLIVSHIGAEGANFIEVSILLPSMIIFMLGYIKLSTVIFSKQKIFYIICVSFLAFFLIFAFVTFPNLSSIIPNKGLISIASKYYPSLKWFDIIYINWPFILFNIFSEFWINVMLALLFWQFVNSITPYEQAKRFYPLLGFIGNFALIIGGMILKYVCIDSCMETIIATLTIIITITGIAIIGLFSHIAKFERNGMKAKDIETKKTSQISFKESLQIVFSSKIIWLLSIIVIAYGFVTSISIGLWKDQANKLYPSVEEYMVFMSNYEKFEGISAITFMIITSLVLRKLSWFTSAILTPIITLFTGLAFFLWLSYSQTHALMQENPYALLNITVIIGTIHVILVKSAKFSLFSSTKELAFISLKKDLRDKGKAAVELLGERVGKAGGAFFQTILLTLLPGANYSSLSSVFLVIVIFTIATWLCFTWMLYNQLREVNDKI